MCARVRVCVDRVTDHVRVCVCACFGLVVTFLCWVRCVFSVLGPACVCVLGPLCLSLPGSVVSFLCWVR